MAILYMGSSLLPTNGIHLGHSAPQLPPLVPPSLRTYPPVTAEGRCERWRLETHGQCKLLACGQPLSRSLKPREGIMTFFTRHTFTQEASGHPKEEEMGAWVGQKLSISGAHSTRQVTNAATPGTVLDLTDHLMSLLYVTSHL